MQKVANKDLQNPNACIICEEQPAGESVLDTERYAPFNPTYPLNGRKYVCERCAGEIAERLGYESGDSVQQARVELDQAKAELGNVRARVEELANHIREFITSPVSLSPEASANALEAVFNPTESPSAAVLGVEGVTDVTATAPREEVDVTDEDAVQDRVEPQAPNGADILENEAVQKRAEQFDGNLAATKAGAFVPAEYVEANQPVERDENGDVIGAETETPARGEVNEDELAKDEASAEATLDEVDSKYGENSDPLAGVSEEAVEAEKEAAGVKSTKRSKKSK